MEGGGESGGGGGGVFVYMCFNLVVSVGVLICVRLCVYM